MRLPVWAVFGATAAGCSLIIPLDYVGGGSAGAGSAGMGQGGGSGGGTPLGGTSDGAEAGAGEGGNGEAGSVNGGGGGSSARGGGDSGGRGGSSGGVGGTAMGGSTVGGVGGSSMGGDGGSSMGGDDSGGAPPEGGAGNNMGGTSGGGAGGGGAGSGGAGSGGKGGTGGTAGCSFDLTSNPLHCGSCMTACPAGNECIDSKCVSSPCDELGCGSVQMPVNNGDGPRKDNVGTTNDVCVEVLSYTPTTGHLPAINCWNSTGRTVEVNGVVVTCGEGDKPLDMPKRKGGYCYHALPGESASAGFVMPYAASGCCP